jgi:hypothetical protein
VALDVRYLQAPVCISQDQSLSLNVFPSLNSFSASPFAHIRQYASPAHDGFVHVPSLVAVLLLTPLPCLIVSSHVLPARCPPLCNGRPVLHRQWCDDCSGACNSTLGT